MRLQCFYYASPMFFLCSFYTFSMFLLSARSFNDHKRTERSVFRLQAIFNEVIKISTGILLPITQYFFQFSPFFVWIFCFGSYCGPHWLLFYTLNSILQDCCSQEEIGDPEKSKWVSKRWTFWAFLKFSINFRRNIFFASCEVDFYSYFVYKIYVLVCNS
jgi:hypothetical protein